MALVKRGEEGEAEGEMELENMKWLGCTAETIMSDLAHSCITRRFTLILVSIQGVWY